MYGTGDTYAWYGTVEAYGERESVDGFVDAAVWTSLSPIGTSCSQTRTLVVQVAGRTVVIGVCDGVGSADENAVLAAARTVIDHVA